MKKKERDKKKCWICGKTGILCSPRFCEKGVKYIEPDEEWWCEKCFDEKG